METYHHSEDVGGEGRETRFCKDNLMNFSHSVQNVVISENFPLTENWTERNSDFSQIDWSVCYAIVKTDSLEFKSKICLSKCFLFM